MRKIYFTLACMAYMLVTGCAGLVSGTSSSPSASSGRDNMAGSIWGAVANGETLGNVLAGVIGMDKLSQEQLCATWRYDGPGCAFTSADALARAGGEVAATQIEQKLEPEYAKLGLTAGNTQVAFRRDGTFAAMLGGKNWNGNYTYDPQTGALTMRGMLLGINGFVSRNGMGISLLFESRKLLSMIQMLSAVSGNATLGSIGEISKNYDGVRLGFDMRK